jgi:hypothetical protein
VATLVQDEQRSNAMTWARNQLIGDPVFLMRASGLEPDPWQIDVLRSTAPRIILNASRQSGKSQITAACAVALAARASSRTDLGAAHDPQERLPADLRPRLTSDSAFVFGGRSDRRR